MLKVHGGLAAACSSCTTSSVLNLILPRRMEALGLASKENCSGVAQTPVVLSGLTQPGNCSATTAHVHGLTPSAAATATLALPDSAGSVSRGVTEMGALTTPAWWTSTCQLPWLVSPVS